MLGHRSLLDREGPRDKQNRSEQLHEAQEQRGGKCAKSGVNALVMALLERLRVVDARIWTLRLRDAEEVAEALPLVGWFEDEEIVGRSDVNDVLVVRLVHFARLRIALFKVSHFEDQFDHAEHRAQGLVVELGQEANKWRIVRLKHGVVHGSDPFLGRTAREDHLCVSVRFEELVREEGERKVGSGLMALW